jgi:hypothetical protein
MPASTRAEESQSATARTDAKSIEKTAKGPLQIHPQNGRYFTDGTKTPDGSLRAIYLTGSHTWGNLCDYPPDRKYPPFDYKAYLDFLDRYQHNFFRLWPGGLDSTPPLYERTGPEKAGDGLPRVDFTRLNPEYFERLRKRVLEARERGIYVDIVLFFPYATKAKHWPRHLFNSANNVQGINCDTNGDGLGAEAFDLSVPEITKIQEAYVRKVIDTVNDLDNVLFEIGNEGDLTSVKWQYHFIKFIQEYESQQTKQHPVGMTAVFDWVGGTGKTDNESLWKSSADWIAPGLAPYQSDPPAADGKKAVIADVDHIWPVAPQEGWIWKCFLRGIQPIHMDAYTYGDPDQGFDLHGITKDAQEKLRRAMGATRKLSERIHLAAVTPQNDLASTGYCLAEVGAHYVVYQPAMGSKFTVKLVAGDYHYEWIDPASGTVKETGSFTAVGGSRSFTPPLDGYAALYVFRAAKK